MRYAIVVAIVLLSSGCSDIVRGDQINAAEFVCTSYGGVQEIDPNFTGYVRCRSGVTFSIPTAIDAYTVSMKPEGVILKNKITGKEL